MAGKYYRLMIMLMEICPVTLRKLFLVYAAADKRLQIPYTTLDAYLQFRKEDLYLLERHLIKSYHFNLLFPITGNVDINSWELSLLLLLFEKIFDIEPDILSCIHTIRKIRKKFFHLARPSHVTEQMFITYFGELSEAVKYLASSHSDKHFVENIKNGIKIVESSELGKLESLLEKWYATLEPEIKGQTEKIAAKSKQDMGNLAEFSKIINLPPAKDLWKDCIEQLDIKTARHLLEENILPDELQLQSAFKTFCDEKGSNGLLKDICSRIEERLIEENENIEYIKGCYKHDEPNQIVFVYYTSQSTEIDSPYNLHFIEQDIQDNKEAMKEMEIENSTEYKCEKMQREANACLRVMSSDLMDAHSNLTCISVSTVKFNKMCKPEEEICIAFYVIAKGYIPVGEDFLPFQLEHKGTIYKTDVREGRFAVANAGPRDFHEDLKIGCRIESSTIDGGTIGGFVDHPEHGVCAITCAHVLLTMDQFNDFYSGNIDMHGLPLIQTFQPQQPDLCGQVCDVRLFRKNQKGHGMDIAFVKIEDARKPKTTSFPDIYATDIDGNQSDTIEKVLSKCALRYCPRSVMQSNQISQNTPVVKYGCTTKLTSGTFYGVSTPRLLFFQQTGRKRKTYTFADQLEIRRSDDGKPFSDTGDSGSMVFVVDNENELTVLGILIGGNNVQWYVTPICDILEEIEMPLPYALADPNSARKIVDEIKQSAVEMRRKCDAIISQLEQ